MNLPLPTILLQRGLVGPKDLAAALCVALGMQFVDFDDTAVQPQAAHTVPEALARQYARHRRRDRRATPSSSPSPTRPTTPRSARSPPPSTPTPGSRWSPAGAERQELLAAIEGAYGPPSADAEQRSSAQGIDPELHRMFERVQDDRRVGPPPRRRASRRWCASSATSTG